MTDDGLEGALTNANQLAPGATELPAAKASTSPSVAAAPKQHEKLGRNDPCWCGSKRKFKQCHGRP
jgi:preprotein translocase subunit SecA